MSRFDTRSDIAVRSIALSLVLSGLMAAVLFAQPGQTPPDETAPATTRPADAPATADQPAPPASQPMAGEPAADASGADNAEATTEQPAKATGDPDPKRQPTPAEILRELTRTGSENKGVVLPDAGVRPRRTEPNRDAMKNNAIAPVKSRLLPDGYRLVDRPGRLTRESDYWVISFESRSRGAPEMPIRLLPNRLLEDMEEFSAGGTKDVVFIISGEVTEYRGVNYLLIQKLLTRPSVGNLK